MRDGTDLCLEKIRLLCVGTLDLLEGCVPRRRISVLVVFFCVERDV